MLNNRKFINEIELADLLEKSASCDEAQINDIIEESKECKGLSLKQAAMLLNVTDEKLLTKIFSVANEIKTKIYGKRVVLFAPLYVSSYCTNNCLYCGFRVANKEMERISLSQEEIADEIKAMLEQGHKRTLLLSGEHPTKASLDYLIQSIDTIYSVRDSKGSSIRRINIEIEPLTDAEFRHISEVPIGTYTVFQETYHQDTYKKMHPSGKKSDYKWRLEVMHRALSNGLHDVGIGVLFGLYDYRFEVLALLQHAQSLENELGIGPHTISIPRIRHANNAPESYNPKYAVTDDEFRKLIAVLRLSVPFAGMILSTRENATLRMELLNLGISQISAGSKTSPGGYKQAFNEEVEHSQFSLNDGRSSGEVIKDVLKLGYIPSFCTSCYRIGRVGEKFMELAKPGNIKTFCHPNALVTLQEYLLDYADAETKEIGKNLILSELEKMENKEAEITKRMLYNIQNGKRDICL